MKQTQTIILLIIAAAVIPAAAKVDLTVLPDRDMAQITIYNSADLTLVREVRNLTVKEGLNKLQFSWANTLIDPTSLQMIPKANADKIDINELVFPPRVKNVGLWNIQSEMSGKIPVEITYFTSGLTWRAFYMGTLTRDEKTMFLQGYVRVTNNSGEDYENAQTRLIVGKVHILDQIAQLAQRLYPYESPIQVLREKGERLNRLQDDSRTLMLFDGNALNARMGGFGGRALDRKEVVKEGLSEYFLYTIEGTETIPTGWSKRLPSFKADKIPVVNLYKFEQERYGNNVIRFLSFKNDEEHKLGETPIPGGVLKVYRNVDTEQHLSYEGQSSFKYIPVDEDVELNLGPVADVVVEPKLMKYQTENHRFNRDGNIDGWDEIRSFNIEVRNTRDLPVKVEIMRNFGTQFHDLKNSGDYGEYEKYDMDTAKYTLELKPNSKQVFRYESRIYQGTRREAWKK